MHIRLTDTFSAASDLYDTSTHFLLELLQNADDNQYPLLPVPTKELHSFDASLLVFLRRIRHVVLRVYGKDNKLWERCLRRTLVLEDETANRSPPSTWTKANCENLPFEEKRPEFRTADLTLAFPTSSFPAQPSRGPRYVHALLPFLLNGDFLLTADRSHIDVSSPWNQSLRGGLAAAFIQAVQKFSQGSMKYFWPFFVPDSEVSSFFQPSREAILQDLAGRAILEGWDGTMLRPSNLVYLARVLLPLAQVASHKETLARLAIIPLCGGRWMPADQQPVFFSEDLGPTGFGIFPEMLIIDPVAAADDDRRSLYQKLGILGIDRPDMCSKIAKFHASTSFNPQIIARAKLISHATFLFQASWRPDFDVDLWFATSDGGVCRGSELYIRGNFKDGSPYMFDSNALIYTGLAQSSNCKSHPWLTAAECKARKIDLDIIYPTCQGLSSWLIDATTLGIDGTVAEAASIGPSWT
ncbi:hypothetical protein F4814DRAFT_452901 [Daldinia grandis]|nr:hypothetical protein F4814DRAFT_452901 [Daldinia grandis]